MWRAPVIGLLGLAVIPLLLMTPAGGAHAQTTTVEIGALLTEAQSNADRFEAMKLAVDDFNTANTDYKLSIASYSLGDDPLAALQKAYDNGNGPRYYVGPTSSGNVEKVRAYADSNNIIIVSPSSTAARLAIAGDTTFRLAPSDAKQAPFVAEILKGDEKTHIVTVYRNDAWGSGLATGIPTNYNEATFVGIPFDPDSEDHAQVAADLKTALDAFTAQNIHTAVLYLGFENDLIRTFEAVHGDPALESVLDVRWYGADGIANKPSIVEHAVAGPLANRVDLTATIFFISESDLTKSVKDRLAPRVRGEINQYVYTSYDAVRIIGEAIKDVGADDPVLVAASFIDVADRHVGALGDYRLDAAGDLREPSAFTAYRVVQGDDGTFMWDRFLQAEIKIGMLLLLDPDSFNDVDRQKAMEIGAIDFNLEQLELGSGYKVTLTPVVIDNDPVDALTDAHVNKQIDYYVGPTTSAAAKALLPYANSNNLVMVSPSSTAPELAIPGDSLFRLVPDDRKQAPFIAQTLANDGKTHVVVVQRDDVWGRDMVAAFRDSYTGTVSDAITYSADIDTVDFAGLARQLEGALDATASAGPGRTAVLFVGFHADFIDLVRAILADAGLDGAGAVSWYGTGGITASTPIILASDVAAFAESVGLTSSTYHVSGTGETDHLTEQLRRLDPNIAPSPYLHTSYDAVHILGDAVITSFATDAAVKDIFADVANGHLRDPLHLLRDSHHTLGTGITGDFQLNAAGDLESPLLFATFTVKSSPDGSYAWVQQSALGMPSVRVCR